MDPDVLLRAERTLTAGPGDRRPAAGRPGTGYRGVTDRELALSAARRILATPRNPDAMAAPELRRLTVKLTRRLALVLTALDDKAGP